MYINIKSQVDNHKDIIKNLIFLTHITDFLLFKQN